MKTDFHQLPQSTAMDRITLDEIQQEALRAAAAYWQSLRGGRPWPSREELNLRQMASFVGYTLLLRVIDGGEDFEHRIIGDAAVRSFPVSLQNRRFSEIATDAPELMAKAFFSCRKVLETRAPVALRERSRNAELLLAHAELIILPLGPTQECIDHLLVVIFHGARIAPDHAASHG